VYWVSVSLILAVLPPSFLGLTKNQKSYFATLAQSTALKTTFLSGLALRISEVNVVDRHSPAKIETHRRNKPEKISKIRVNALFTDYDGTLSPINVSPSESVVPPKTLAALHKISQHIPVAVITVKDLEFIGSRTRFASAWATLGGLEIKSGKTITRKPCLKNKRPQIKDALDYAKSLVGEDLTIEEKKDSEGNVVAFSVDWRQTKNKAHAAAESIQITAFCKTQSLNVVVYEDQPFLDVFPFPVDKGKALMDLKKKLGLKDGILYLGDSNVDNSAFKKADIAVGVIHLETPNSLTCDYFVKAEELFLFLENLLENDFCFDAGWQVIMNQEEAKQFLKDNKKKLSIK
jgi:HAD superfamily hydrolase (TIGR01484 family)